MPQCNIQGIDYTDTDAYLDVEQEEDKQSKMPKFLEMATKFVQENSDMMEDELEDVPLLPEGKVKQQLVNAS